MTVANIVEALIGLGLVIYICVRQMTWTPVNTGRMWRMPLILGVIGLVILVQGSSGARLSGIDIALLVIEAVAAIVTGALMGFIAVFRPITEKGKAAVAASRRPPEQTPTVESRTGWLGIVLWVLLIAVRVVVAIWGQSLGSAIADSSGVILLVVALNRAVRTLVFSTRHDRHVSLAAR